MKKNICSAIFALFVSLLLTATADAAGTVAGVGFQCTNDPQYRAWFHSYAHEPRPVAEADAAALAQRICTFRFNGQPVNAKVNYSDGSHVAVSAADPNLPTNLPPQAEPPTK
jgi:hypothetical protein